ncbi:MAG TPA: PhoD-like phosphatase N-terminal domain-containing protein, partial [Actinomycetota bacterium]|nr:PhoD-like phosphatase N-terminal domain-containing protein [Actinomycetota bacterium]
MPRKLTLLTVVIALVATAALSTTSSAGLTVDFTHGVAARAGSNFAQLWTRSSAAGVEFQLTISDKANLSGGQVFDVTGDAGHDNTVKKTVKGLESNTRYWYQFSSGPIESHLGTFRTLPRKDRAKPFELAITGDSDVLWQDPPEPQDRNFSVLDRVREDRPDMFIYMGDTIYSDSETGAPLAETVEEKWDKYKNNRVPAAKQALRKLNTWAVWDDH